MTSPIEIERMHQSESMKVFDSVFVFSARKAMARVPPFLNSILESNIG